MEAIEALLACYPAHNAQDDIWGASRIHVSEYLSTVLPPDELITSVHAVVRFAGQVLVVSDPHTLHILPGGKREPGETLEATLRREVLEETGWEIGETHRANWRTRRGRSALSLSCGTLCRHGSRRLPAKNHACDAPDGTIPSPARRCV